MIPVGFALARIGFTVTGDIEPMVTTVGVKYDVQTPEVWADMLDDALVDTGLCSASNMSNQYVFTGVSLTYMSETGEVEYQSTLPAIPGTWTIQPLPNNCALLVRKRTALGGRRHRGRFYFPPCHAGEDTVSGAGFIAGAMVTAIQGYLNAFLARMTSDGGALYIFHEPSESNPGAALPPPTAITGLELATQIATQRRRLR